ncbi:MAG TPA: histidine--tRNA ligase [Gemmataceae bacterium]|jgi:histidyl-tRNA synthetase|nr:histidine--tRNA ligase [Gemmataceae bacterium]
MPDLIQPRTLKGFRDYLPEVMIPRERLLEQVRHVCRSYGFAPIDTPALEYTEILLGKGGEESDKLVYRFVDHGGRDVALRFDLTVPFARFAAQYIGQLGVPFKRYAMGPVWRGENTAHGRYREFWQCDFDLIGTAANAADIEVALVIHDLMRALGFERFQMRINNRLVLNGLLEELNLAGHAGALLRALDKLPKIGREAVQAEMVQRTQIDSDKAGLVVDLAETKGSNDEILERCEHSFFGGNAKAAEGIRRLRELTGALRLAGVPEERFQLDLAIARGLDYYTGTIYETFLLDLPGIGSVCSGGRYDDLAKLFTKQSLPGVGASLGLDRLVAAMEELGVLQKTGTPAQVLVVLFDANRIGEYQGLARSLRARGLGVEVFPEPKKVGQQLQYAEKRGFRVALIAGPDEFAQGTWKVKDLAARTENAVPTSGVAEAVARIVSVPLKDG